MTIKTESGTWIISEETRTKLNGDKIENIKVTVAWNEARGYIREFYGDAIIDLA